jgi:hypothetical protein
LLSSSLFEAPCTHARDSEICSSTSASRHRSSSVSSSFGGAWGGECARQGQGQGQGRGAGAAGRRGAGGGWDAGSGAPPTAPTPGGCARLGVIMLIEGVRVVRRGFAGHTWMRACHQTILGCARVTGLQVAVDAWSTARLERRPPGMPNSSPCVRSFKKGCTNFLKLDNAFHRYFGPIDKGF